MTHSRETPGIERRFRHLPPHLLPRLLRLWAA